MVSARALNRTLLRRQHLLERADVSPLAMVEHLVGLQAQDVLPPYLSLWARIDGFDPHVLSDALESRAAVRLVAMRGTIHLMTVADACELRALSQPLLTKAVRTVAWGRDFPASSYDGVAELARSLLADGPLPVKQLGERIAESFPDRAPGDCGNLARHLVPLVQLPPRGLWGRSGGQVYDTLESWTGEAPRDPDRADVVRRYLRAFGPATPADVTTWSGATGMRTAFQALGDELVELVDEQGRKLWDLAELSLADDDLPAPVRLLGTYDNLWLSHAGRDRVTTSENRRRWAGVNGGNGATVFADGMLEGSWRRTPSGQVEVTLYRTLTRRERSELDAEVAALETFLAL